MKYFFLLILLTQIGCEPIQPNKTEVCLRWNPDPGTCLVCEQTRIHDRSKYCEVYRMQPCKNKLCAEYGLK